MRWLIRQWHRVQLARELLDEYEREERERIPWPEIMRRIEAASGFGHDRPDAVGLMWAASARAKAEQYPSGA